jgi:hypothetical protein
MSDKFLDDDLSGWTPGQCVLCKHLVYKQGMPAAGCPAFPGGIPDEVLVNDFDHRRPHPDEVAPVHFEPRADAPAGPLRSLLEKLDALR